MFNQTFFSLLDLLLACHTLCNLTGLEEFAQKTLGKSNEVFYLFRGLPSGLTVSVPSGLTSSLD